MFNERFKLPNQNVEAKEGRKILNVRTPEEAVRMIESNAAIFLPLSAFEQKKARFSEILKSKSERGKEELLSRVESLLDAFKKSGRTITEVRYSSAVPDTDIEVGGWHEDDPDATYPDGWVRILVTTEGDTTEYKNDDGSIVRPGSGEASIHTGNTTHRAPAEYKGQRRTQLMVNMVFDTSR